MLRLRLPALLLNDLGLPYVSANKQVEESHLHSKFLGHEFSGQWHFPAASCRCLQKGAKVLLLHLPPRALCGSVLIHPLSKLGSFKVLVIRTADFYEVVTSTLLCLYCHNCLKGSHVLLCKFLDSHEVIPVKTEYIACSEEDVNGLLDNGTATALCLPDIPPFFSASSQSPESDMGWIVCQRGPAGEGAEGW